MKLLMAVADYVLGFFALSVFSILAFRSGSTTPDTWRVAFLVSASLAVVELGILLRCTAPANRLILAANLWLIGGGVAFLTKQWWILDIYETWHAAGLLGVMVLTGVVTTVASPAGFIAAKGPARSVLVASLALLAATLAAFAFLMLYPGNKQTAAVLPILSLAWLARALRLWVTR